MAESPVTTALCLHPRVSPVHSAPCDESVGTLPVSGMVPLEGEDAGGKNGRVCREAAMTDESDEG